MTEYSKCYKFADMKMSRSPSTDRKEMTINHRKWGFQSTASSAEEKV
jgi:hypothetical protein